MGFRRVVPLKAAAAVSNKLPRSTCVMLPGVGHLSHEEAPELLANTLSSFFVNILCSQEAEIPV